MFQVIPLQTVEPRGWNQVSYTADGFFTGWAAREAQDTAAVSVSLLQWVSLTQE